MSTSTKSRIGQKPILVIYCKDCKKRVIADEVYDDPNSNWMQFPVLKCPTDHTHQICNAFEVICLNCERPFLVFSEEDARQKTLCPECSKEILDSLKYKLGEDPTLCHRRNYCHDLSRRNCLGFANLCGC